MFHKNVYFSWQNCMRIYYNSCEVKLYYFIFFYDVIKREQKLNQKVCTYLLIIIILNYYIKAYIV